MRIEFRDGSTIESSIDRNTVTGGTGFNWVYEPYKNPLDKRGLRKEKESGDNFNYDCTEYEPPDMSRTLESLELFRKVVLDSFAQSVYEVLDDVLTYGYENYSGESLCHFEKGIDMGIMAFEKLCEELNVEIDVEALKWYLIISRGLLLDYAKWN